MEYFVYVAACFAVLCITTYLIFHQDYEDGIVGRIALAFMGVPSFIIVMEYVVSFGKEYPIYKTTVLSQCGIALFFIRHLYRFMRWRKVGDHEWRPSKK